MTFSEIPIRFILLKKESNIANHLRWLEYLAGPKFVSDWRQSIQTGGSLQEMIASARSIVDEYIYAFNTSDRTTGRIKKSFTAKALDTDEVSEVAVYSDPSVAPSKGPFESGDPAKFSYAAFFEDPKFNTFLPPKDNPFDTRRYRPFFKPMTEAQHLIQRQLAFRTIVQTIRRRMPRSLTEGED